MGRRVQEGSRPDQGTINANAAQLHGGHTLLLHPAITQKSQRYRFAGERPLHLQEGLNGFTVGA